MKDLLRKKRYEPTLWQPFYKVLWNVFNVGRVIAVPSYRSRVFNSWRYKENYHQFSNFTSENRYPDLFEMAKQHFSAFENPKLLSFGCSTGEEVATLASYLPQSTVIGVDINDWCVSEAKKKNASSSTFFYHSLSEEFKETHDFDAIFCLAVFQNPENRHDKTRQISSYLFQHFEKQLIELDQKLKINGLLFIDQTDFNFLETSLMKRYQIAPFPENKITRQRPLFNKNNQKIAEINASFRVFRKVK